MNYGLPYQGSKNLIAEEIIKFLPEGKRLVDLFGGGGAISHCASLTYKWDSVLYNELSTLVCNAFKMAINGDFKDERRWISREDFNRLKKSDPYAAFCFSFSNNLKMYCYSLSIEPYKKACHYAVVFNEWDEYRLLCPETADKAHDAIRDINDISVRRKLFQVAICKELKRLKNNELIKNNPLYSSCKFRKNEEIDHLRSLERLERLESLERLQSLESLERLQSLESLQSLERLQSLTIAITNGSYEDYIYEEGDIVYCDPPYMDTDCGSYEGFDNEKFFQWVESRPYHVYFSHYENSELNKRFRKVWEQKKRVTTSLDKTKVSLEVIYTNDMDIKTSFYGKQLYLF